MLGAVIGLIGGILALTLFAFPLWLRSHASASSL